MVSHYFKIATRNLLKHKTHSLISAICLSVGMTCFSIVNYYLAEISGATKQLPDSEQRVKIQIDGGNWLSGLDEIKALTAHPIPGIKQLSFHSIDSKAEVAFIGEEKEERPYIVSYMNVNPSFFLHYQANLIQGTTLPAQPDEVILSESCASKIYGKKNPVGTLLKIAVTKENKKEEVIYYRVVNVTKDFSKSLGVQADIYFSYLREDAMSSFQIEGLLETANGLNAANESLRSITTLYRGKTAHFIASKEIDQHHDYQQMLATIFVSFLSSLILLSGMINFLKFIIQSFYNRNRELALRKCMGATTGNLFWLLFTEAFLMLTISLLFSLVLSECVNKLLPVYITSKQFMPIDICHLYIIQLCVYLLLLVICSTIMLYPVYHLRKSRLIGTITGNKQTRHIFRNIMMSVQLCVCIFFMGITIVIHLFNQDTQKIYFPLSVQESDRTLCLEINSITLYNNKDAVLSQIKMLPGVEETCTVSMTGSYNSFLGSNYESADHRTLSVSIREGDSNYFHFFRIPFKGEVVDTRATDVVYVSETFQKQLDQDSIAGSVKLGEQTYRIIGTYKACFGENQTEHNQYNMSVFIPTSKMNVIYARFRDGLRFSTAKAQIEKICRNYVPESLPLKIQRLDVYKSTVHGIRDMMYHTSLLLSTISIFLIILSVYSAISMDTTSRQKEVAIRKINGATPRTIALMFGKVYIILFLLAYTITYPLMLLFVVDSIGNTTVAGINAYVWGIFLFILVGMLIVITTAYKIYTIMHLNPAKIIKNE